MNPEIMKLALDAGYGRDRWNNTEQFEEFLEKFAQLIVQENIKILQNEWYELNNQSNPEIESPRDVGLRVGRKTEIVALIDKVKKHWGYE